MDGSAAAEWMKGAEEGFEQLQETSKYALLAGVCAVWRFAVEVAIATVRASGAVVVWVCLDSGVGFNVFRVCLAWCESCRRQLLQV